KGGGLVADLRKVARKVISGGFLRGDLFCGDFFRRAFLRGFFPDCGGHEASKTREEGKFSFDSAFRKRPRRLFEPPCGPPRCKKHLAGFALRAFFSCAIRTRPRFLVRRSRV